MKRLPNVTVELRPSRLLAVALGIAHVAAGVAVFLADVPVWVRLGSSAAVGSSLAWAGFRHGWNRGRDFIARVELLDGRWRLETRAGAAYRADLSGGYAHPGIVILNFRLENGRRRSLALLPDSADAESLRRLRVWLRIWRDTDPADTST
ncbi:MAG: hypothetical protein IPP10_11470 [Candidatus Competibacteraceae bacterium]|nr:hypothetical protein [Candidatus Competibacteraceae bacterium]MBK7982339.1 hypothetical protein [Candidatus Competibacteraceae bacterium]MBK8899111.1 hypothetical protein [Candidatus Competibacteraceae bacterium]MBK8963151.1 hypothetical protein [Candidatus Competibacteraceae bacterium]MBK9952113.1 hypothetical protein [Candidatus Competibacteraceae bacterium]